MTHDGVPADLAHRAAAAGRTPLAVLTAGAPSCRVVHLLEEWDRWTCAQAQRLTESLRRL